MSSDYIDIDIFTNKQIDEALNDSSFLLIPETLVYRSKHKPDLYNLDNVAKWAYYHFKRLKKSKFVFADYREGVIIKNIKAANQLYTILNTKYNVPVDSFYYMTGCLHIPESLEKFNKVLQEQNYITMKLMTSNNNDSFYYTDIGKYPQIYDSINTSVRVKQKKYMCLNGIPRAGRISTVALLLDRNLMDQGYVSLVSDQVVAEAEKYSVDQTFIDKFPKIHNTVYKQITENAKLFPMLQTTDLDQYTQVVRNASRMHVLTHEDIDLYNNSYFSVIPETAQVVFDGDDPNYALFYDCYQFNEKTYRTIAAKHPFILGHRPLALKALRDTGYKTFHPYINESYDLIEDDEDRIIAIIDEVERLCSFTDDEWIEWQHNVLPIVQHNFNVLKNVGEFKIQGFA